jgi:hypothetical protein
VIVCATCGAAPAGTYNDGSPRFPPTCDHPRIDPGDPLHPGTWAESPASSLTVYLTDDELADARAIGERMHADSRSRGEKALLKTYDPASAFVLGVQGEIGVSRWAGVEYRPVFRLQKGAPDVASMHVRTRRDPTFGLPVRTHEVRSKPRAPFLLANAQVGLPKVVIRGWILAVDAAREEWIEDYGGHGRAFFVPPERLHDPGELLTFRRALAGLPPIGVLT